MTLLEKVKVRLGVFYSEETKDNEIKSMINGAINYFKGAGWDFTVLLVSLADKESKLKILRDELIVLESELEELEKIEEPTPEQLDDIDRLEIEICDARDSIADAELEISVIEEGLSLPIEAITLYCKMAQSTDPSQLTNHPVLMSMIAQGRAEVVTDG